jgi:hypothetical protein
VPLCQTPPEVCRSELEVLTYVIPKVTSNQQESSAAAESAERTFTKQTSVLFLAMFLLAGITPAHAVSVVVPNSLGGVEANIDNCIPFGCFLDSTRYQQIYASSQFTGPLLITSILFRPDAEFGGVFSATFSSVDVYLSTTSKAVDGLSATLEDNLGADNTLVRSGVLTLSSSYSGPAGGPKDFDIVINLTAPFLYDPDRGNLLLDVIILGSLPVVSPFDAHNATAGTTSRIYGFGVPSMDSIGLVTRFDGVSPVPEPGSFVLLTLGSVLLCIRRPK